MYRADRVALDYGRAVSVHVPLGSAFDVRTLGARSLPAAWAEHFRRAPERPVLGEPGRAWLSWGELEAESARAAGRLAGAGLCAGERVLFSAAGSVAVAIAHVACLRLGLVVVPANPAYRDAEWTQLVAAAQPRAALVADPARAAWLRAAGAAGFVVSPALELADSPPPALDRPGPNAPALLAFTSGTTGRPKGVPLTHGNLHATAEALRIAWRWTAEDRLVHALPLFHMHGLGVALHGTLQAGAAAFLLPRFDAGEVLDAVERERATLFFGVPTMLHRLADHKRAARLARLRLLVSGSAALDAGLHARIGERTGQLTLERYGMTETGMLVSNPVDGARVPGSVGFPLPGVELRLAEDGEIEVRGPNVFGGYLARPDANAEAFTADGWFRTGDLGALDPDGRVRIVGRAKELVISGGYNVHPREVEEALLRHPAVREAAVVGTPSPEWGELVTAYLVSERELPLAELRAHCAEALAAYKHPRLVHRVAALPRNALGKVQRHRLRDGSVLPE
jgi:malonyl-CoA/methylmalonyl-CoA synthetase